EGDDARRSAGGAAHRRLRHAVRLYHRPVDDARLRGGGLQEPGRRQAADAARPARPVGRPSMRTWLQAMVATLLFGAVLAAQQPARVTARASAPLDLTGQWVSI